MCAPTIGTVSRGRGRENSGESMWNPSQVYSGAYTAAVNEPSTVLRPSGPWISPRTWCVSNLSLTNGQDRQRECRGLRRSAVGVLARDFPPISPELPSIRRYVTVDPSIHPSVRPPYIHRCIKAGLKTKSYLRHLRQAQELWAVCKEVPNTLCLAITALV